MGDVTAFFPGRAVNGVEYIEQLKTERHLSNIEISELGIRVVSGQEAEEFLGYKEPNPLIQLPYWDITGEKLLDNRGYQLARYRRTAPNSKGERYTQRKGTGSRHYLPKLAGIDWLNISKDPDIPIFYTEGEFKAISGCKNLGPTVGNAGVEAWRGQDGINLAAPLNDFVWRGRTVYIAYDAESTSSAAVPLKSNVARALSKLALDLKTRGASVKMLLIARTPLFKEGVKLGLDDYFNAGGTVEELMKTAEDAVGDEELSPFWDKYAIYRHTKPHILDLKKGSSYSKKEFIDLIEPSQRDIGKGKLVPIAQLFLNHPEVNWFDQYIFDPQLPSGFLSNEHKFNLWSGFAVEPNRTDNYARVRDDFEKFQRGIWGEYYGYFSQWLAHLFQKPWERTTISVVLISRVKGVGKSLTGDLVRCLIGGTGSAALGVQALTDRFSGPLERKVFVQVDESEMLEPSQEGKLRLLTGPSITIEKKGKDAYTLDNLMRLFFTSNKAAAVRAASDERRFFVHFADKTAEDGLEDSEWSIFLRTRIAPMLQDPEALGNIMYYLMNEVDISGWDAFAPALKTDAFRDLADASTTRKVLVAETAYQAMVNAFGGNGWWATNKMLVGTNNSVWSEIQQMFDNDGGVRVQHQTMEGGKAQYWMIWIPRGSPVKWVQDPRKGKRLAIGGAIGGAPIKSSMMAVKNLVEPIIGELERLKGQ